MQRLVRQSLFVFYFAGFGLLLPIAAPAQETADAALGTWTAEEAYFNAVVRIERTDDGALAAFVASEQLLSNPESTRRTPFSDVTVRGDSIFLAAPRIGLKFRGAVAADGSSIKGPWTQGANEAVITLTPAEANSSTPSRPQHPEPPFPYATQEITFQNPTNQVELAGTLSRPQGNGPFPGVVLLHGSGAHGRDYDIDGHKPFLVLADHLTRQGFAVLRYDMRGVGASEGHFPSASFDDLARDAAAALRYLKNRPEIEPSETGLIAHSAGTLLAPQVVDQLEDAAFLALLMPPS